MKSFIPPVQVTDSRDKANPGDIPPIDTSWTWKLGAVVVTPFAIISLFWFLLARLDWVVQNTLSDYERNAAITATWVVYIVIVAIVLAIIYTFVSWMQAKSRREKLADIYSTNTTIEAIEKMDSKQLMEILTARMAVEQTRAGTVVAPEALSYSPTDSHNASSSSQSTGITTAGGNGGKSSANGFIIPLETLDKV